ncbi:MAG: glycoside hydrolase family 9 protein [Bryobacteraceae bacterium]|nr:glycoside hydrolase family 9 protein [Bryobacteraceae bacterium]
MRVLFLSAFLPAFAAAQSPSAAIRVNQAGYLPGASKAAIVAAAQPAREFAVRRTADAKTVFRGRLGEPMEDADSGERVQVADFSALRTPGRYYVEIPGAGRSWDFEIGPRVYDRVLYLATRSYYGQRCGTAVDLGPEFPGYRYEACHRTGAWHESSGRTGPAPSQKGWHDAGDYGRYVVNSGITTGTLLWAYELYQPQLEKLQLNIPESGDKTPDILDEIRWNLEWMLTMQDTDGGVWHKQTGEKFPGFVLPHEDAMPSYIIGTGSGPYKSTCATADFAAVMAIAARVYPPFDGDFARRAREAAASAWEWAVRNPAVLFSNPKGVSTGAYGDRDCSDEMLWAASELWRTTRNRKYEQYFLEHWQKFRSAIAHDRPPAWPQVSPLALWGWTLSGGPGSEEIRRLIVAAADELASRTEKSGHRMSLLGKDYIWGSNSVAANYGMQLLVAHRLRPDARYLEAALGNLHYLLGRNPLSISYVTRVGANPVRRPHHRPSGADRNEEPWPGLLAGGPNARRQDPAMKKLPEGTPPAKMFLDEQESYATNEVAINWNAPLVFLLAGVMHGK